MLGLCVCVFALAAWTLLVQIRLPEVLALLASAGEWQDEPHLFAASFALFSAVAVLLLGMLPSRKGLRLAPHALVFVAVLCGAFAVLKASVDTEWQPPGEEAARMAGNHVIVTGANTGIGLATATRLAGYGAHVTLACRNGKKCNDAVEQVRHVVGAEIGDDLVQAMQLDLADLASVRRFAEAYAEQHDRLDLLVNNAGIIPAEKGAVSVQGIELGFGVMNVGHQALTQWLMPLLDAADEPRVVNVGSAASWMGSFDDSLWVGDGEGDLRGEKTTANGISGSYARSKLANQLFTHELMARHKKVLSLCVHPGGVATQMVAGMMSNIDALFAFAESFIVRNAMQGASPVVYASMSQDARVLDRKQHTYVASVAHAVNPSAPGTNDAKLAARVWDVIERLVRDFTAENEKRSE